MRRPVLLASLATSLLLLSPSLAQDGLPAPAPAAPAAPAADVKDPRLDALVGTWIGRGTLAAQPTLEVWSVAWTLERQFLSVVGTRTVIGDDARATTEHQLFLRPAAAGGYRGAWVDSTGGLATVRATWVKDAIGEGLLVELTPTTPDGPRPTEPLAARWTLAGQTLDIRRLDAQGAEVGRVALERKAEKAPERADEEGEKKE